MSIRLSCLCSLLPLLAPVLPAQEPVRILRTVPIRDLIGSGSVPAPPPLGSFLGFGDHDTKYAVLDIADARMSVLDADEVEEMLVNELCEKLFADGKVSLSRHGSVLFLSGTEAAVKQVEATVQVLRRALLHPVRLRASLFRNPDARDLPVFASADALTSLTAQLPLVWSAETTVASGLQAALSNQRRTRYVRDFEVEVAQNAHIGDPILDEMFEGVHVLAQPHVLADSDELVVYGQFAFGERHGAVQTRDTGVKGYPTLDVPSLDTNSGAFSGRIGNGGALLVTVRNPQERGSNLVLVVQAATAGAAPQQVGDLAFLPITALTSSALRHYLRHERSQESALWLTVMETDSDYIGPLNPDELSAILAEADPDEDTLRVVRGGHVVVRGEQRIKFTLELLRSLQQRWLTNTQVDVQTRLLPGEITEAAFTDVPTETTTELLQGLAFPALAGRSHVFVSGRETTAIVDYDVEIAQKATADNPTVYNPFSGLIVSCLPYPEAESGMIGARLDIDAAFVPAAPRRPLEQANGGNLDMTQSSNAHFAHNGSLVPGREIAFGHGPTVRIGGQNRRTLVSARISVR